jgi:hypothetical protein
MGDDGEPTKELVHKLITDELRARLVVADVLINGSDRIRADEEALQDAMYNGPDAIWDRLELAYCELGDFSAGKYAGGRCAFAVLQPLAWDMSRWAFQMGRRLQIRDPPSLELVQRFNELRERCPFSAQIDNSLRQRLTLEKSRLLRDLLEYERTGPDNNRAGAGPQNSADEERAERIAEMPRALRRALFAFEYAATKLELQPELLTYGDAWDFLTAEGIHDAGKELEDYELPARDTFADYMSQASVRLGEKRRNRRGGKRRG